ncbi:unnamed protein product, partial [Aureobasidium uvarum]
MPGYQPQNYMTQRRKSSVLSNSQDHLWGIRAILAVQSFAWLFFKVFDPTLTVPAPTTTGEHVPNNAPSTVPGVFGGPGIVAPGAGSGIVARDLYARDLYPRNLSMSRSPFSFQIIEWTMGASGAGQRRRSTIWRRNIGKRRQQLRPRHRLSIPSISWQNFCSSKQIVLQQHDAWDCRWVMKLRLCRITPMGKGLWLATSRLKKRPTHVLSQNSLCRCPLAPRHPDHPRNLPHYQVLLRKILSPLLWDESFIFCFFILLSARTVAISFLRDANSATYARSLIARPIRMGIPLAIGLAISYTVYIFMVVLPYSRPSWHVTGLLMFAFGSWWFNSWGWYSATGLFLADVAVNPPLRTAMFRGYGNESGSVRIPYWSLAVLMLGIGTGLKYMWTAGLDNLYWSGESHAHPARYLGGSSFGYFDGTQPYPRMDNWLVIVGILLLVEFSEVTKSILSSKPLKTIGRRSLSYFLVSTLLMYTAGIKLFLYCNVSAGLGSAAAKAVAFFVVLPASIICGELFHWAIDKPAVWAGHAVFDWTRK